MNKRKIITTLIICSFIVLSLSKIIAFVPQIDFRTESFSTYGYNMNYKVIQGENLEQLFGDVGVAVVSPLSNSELHVVVKGKESIIKDLYYVDADRFIPTNVTSYKTENFLLTKNIVDTIINIDDEFLKRNIGYGASSPENKQIEVSLEPETIIPLPSLFTDIDRPNFGALFNQSFDDFLPLIIGKNFDRYEAELMTLILDNNFDIRVLNNGYDQFTVSIDIKLDIKISLKAVWEKKSGLLSSISIRVIGEKDHSIFVLSLLGYEKIVKNIPDKINFFITNSGMNYDLTLNSDEQTNFMTNLQGWINGINQTQGMYYDLKKIVGIYYEATLYILNNNTLNYSTDTPIHNTLVSYFPPFLHLHKEYYEGLISLINQIWLQLKDEMKGFYFTLSVPGSTVPVYTINDIDLQIQLQTIDEHLHLLADFTLEFTRNESMPVSGKIYVLNRTYNSNLWMVFNKTGELISFSSFYSQNHHSYFIPDDPKREKIYSYNYTIESILEDITKPQYVEDLPPQPTTYVFLGITFYVTVIYFRLRNKKLNKR